MWWERGGWGLVVQRPKLEPAWAAYFSPDAFWDGGIFRTGLSGWFFYRDGELQWAPRFGWDQATGDVTVDCYSEKIRG